MKDWHPATKAAAHAIDAMCRKGLTSTEARRAARVEITRAIEDELMATAGGAALAFDRRPKHGPMEIMGVSYYVVHNLPEPGWRVISPLDREVLK